MKKLFLLLVFLLGQTAYGEIRISQLPLLTHSSIGASDSFPFVNVSGNETARLEFADLINVSLLQMVGDSGSGGSAGFCPAPPAGSAAAGKFLKADGTYQAPKAPTVQIFLSGSGTYTRPSSPPPLYLRVRLVGGGGGGGGTGAGAGTGGTGGNTTFGTSLLAGNGGTGGALSGGDPGTGGTASLGTGPVGLALGGARGMSANPSQTNPVNGAMGGNSPFGGAGTAIGSSGVGQDATQNTGSGGGGAYGGGTQNGSPGGASGGYVDAIIYNPSATYSYAVGAAGTAGAGALTGGAGARGLLEITEFYQ